MIGRVFPFFMACERAVLFSEEKNYERKLSPCDWEHFKDKRGRTEGDAATGCDMPLQSIILVFGECKPCPLDGEAQEGKRRSSRPETGNLLEYA